MLIDLVSLYVISAILFWIILTPIQSSSLFLWKIAVAKQELMAMLEEEELKDAILLVFANKQDSKGALNSRHVL